MYCEKCGKKIEDNGKFCSACGAEVNGVPTEKKSKNKKIMLIVISAVVAVIFLGIVALVGVFVLQNAGLLKRDMILNDVYKITSEIENGKKYEMKDFRKFESDVRVEIYKTYSFELAEIDDTELIVTTDRETDEILQIYLFHRTNYIELNEGSDEVRQFVKENISLYDYID